MLRSLFLSVLAVVFLWALIGAGPGTEEQQFNDQSQNIQDLFKKNEKIALNGDLDAQILAIMEAYHIPGAAVSAFCTDWVYHLGLYGYAQLEDSIPVTEDTKFCIASISKAVTGTILMQAWEDAQFSLDADVSDFLEFPVEHPDCPSSPVTFRQVATHTASLMSNALPVGGIPGSPICERLAEVFDPESPDYDPSIWEPACPGRAYVYSNLGPTLMACLAGEIGGMPFPEYSQAHLFDPLEMDGTTWFGDQVNPEEAAYSYQFSGGEYFLDSAGGVDWFEYPAAGLRTDINDLTRFAQAVMQGGRLGGIRILEDATVDSMFTVQFPDIANDQGLMWYRSYSQSAQAWFWQHGGGVENYYSAVFIREDRDYGIVAMINSESLPAIAQILIAAGTHIRENLGSCEVASTPDTPSRFSLYPIHPNPFNPQTTITFSLDRSEQVEVGVYDLTGRRLTTLASREFSTGSHSLTWNGRDVQGRSLPSGTYVVRLETESGVESRKVTLIK